MVTSAQALGYDAGMPSRGKRVAFVAAVGAIAVLVAAGFSVWPWIVEEYYLRQLDSTDKASRELAAKNLGKLRSARAVPRLIELVEREGRTWRYSDPPIPSTRAAAVGVSPYAEAICEIGPAALRDLGSVQEFSRVRREIIDFIERGEIPAWDLETGTVRRVRPPEP